MLDKVLSDGIGYHERSMSAVAVAVLATLIAAGVLAAIRWLSSASNRAKVRRRIDRYRWFAGPSLDTQQFCEAMEWMDDVVEQINAERAAVEKPADLGRILARLGSALLTVADAAPGHLVDPIRHTARTFISAADELQSGSADLSVAKAQLIYADALSEFEEEAAAVGAYRKKHCEQSRGIRLPNPQP